MVLVTGASGFLGSRTVAVLSQHGCAVRALVRKTSRTDHLCLPNVTIFRGDVGDAESMKPAFEGVEHVIHAAADTSGNKEEGTLSTIQGTKNILALCQQYQVEKLIYISSCSVYGVSDYKEGEVVTEESSLERFPDKRGSYSDCKFRAEQLVVRAMGEGTVPIICLRPGTIYGPGGDVYTPMLGLSLGSKIFAVIGDGRFVLPLVYVDNMVEAILVAMSNQNQNSTSTIYNVVDPGKVTKKQYMEGLVKKLFPGARTVYVPFGLLKALVFLQEIVFKAVKRQRVLTTYRLVSSQKPVVYDAVRITSDLAWKPPVTVETAFNAVVEYERGIR
jgi:nucleoside-diphosphate-sugar epimerase